MNILFVPKDNLIHVYHNYDFLFRLNPSTEKTEMFMLDFHEFYNNIHYTDKEKTAIFNILYNRLKINNYESLICIINSKINYDYYKFCLLSSSDKSFLYKYL